MTDNADEKAIPAVTIIVTPRERFGVVVDSLRSVIADTEPPYQLVYVDAGSPDPIARELAQLCRCHGFSYLRVAGYLSPNAARNTGAAVGDNPPRGVSRQ